jgi:hypothetical protein
MKTLCAFVAILATLCTFVCPVCAATVNDTDLPNVSLGGGTVTDTELPDLPFGGSGETGDVNGDGKVDSTDARLTLQYFVGSVGANDLLTASADVNGDGKIDSTDARLILQFFVGSITAFPKG